MVLQGHNKCFVVDYWGFDCSCKWVFHQEEGCFQFKMELRLMTTTSIQNIWIFCLTNVTIFRNFDVFGSGIHLIFVGNHDTPIQKVSKKFCMSMQVRIIICFHIHLLLHIFVSTYVYCIMYLFSNSTTTLKKYGVCRKLIATMPHSSLMIIPPFAKSHKDFRDYIDTIPCHRSKWLNSHRFVND